MSETVKPIFLLADSQLLFWHEAGVLFLNRVRDLLERPAQEAKAAYIGASNGDRPEFFELFLAAMSQIKIRDCPMIPAAPSARDHAELERADIILLAGGDVRRGWDIFRATGLDKKLVERYYAGAILIGVSAGAVQLGLRGWTGTTGEEIFGTLQLVPFAIDVHAGSAWTRLIQIVTRLGEHGRGLGIPSGGGAIYYPDWSVEPVRRPVTEFMICDDGVRRSLLLAPESDGASPEGDDPNP